MAAASSLNANVREKLSVMFREVIGDDLHGDIEKFVLYDHKREGHDCAVIVTTGGDVFAIANGANTHGEARESELQLRPLRARKLLDICGLGVTDISISHADEGEHQHILIATEKGQVFAWGDNQVCQLGVPRETVLSSPLPLLVGGPLEQEVVVKVASGYGFSTCVTAAGEVWTWGRNLIVGLRTNSGYESQKVLSTPCKVQTDLGSMKGHHVVSVSCGRHFVVALSDKGQLWSWGIILTLQREGRPMNICLTYPTTIHLTESQTFKSVACGEWHALTASSHGRLYAWGDNRYGQLGCDNKEPNGTSAPRRVNLGVDTPASFHPCSSLAPARTTEKASLGPYGLDCFTEVAAHPGLSISAAQTSSGEVYVWGECKFDSGTRTITVPMLTSCVDLDEAFLIFSTSPATFRLMSMNPTSSPRGRKTIHACVRNSFNDESTADIKFLVDGKAIHAHKAVLKIRSEHCCRMFAKGASWAETEADTITILEFSYPVYHAFLFFLYTETLADGLTPNDLISLVDLAQSYFEEELRALCVARIAETIECDSAPTLYMAAVRCAAKDVEDLCCTFMARNFSQMLSSGALKELEAEKMLVGFLEKAAQKHAFRF